MEEVITMAGYEPFWANIGWWWIVPLVMIAFCFFFMRGRRLCMTGWSTSRNDSSTASLASSDSAREILDKRYVLGEISKEEYEEKRKDIGQTDG
jgi:uncharacterized membrane protein